MFDGDKVLQRRQERCLTYQDGLIHRMYARFVFSIEEFSKTGIMCEVAQLNLVQVAANWMHIIRIHEGVSSSNELIASG